MTHNLLTLLNHRKAEPQAWGSGVECGRGSLVHRLKNLRKIIIPFWRSGHRVEVTSSPSWCCHRRASYSDFSSGHLYVGS